MDRQPVLTGSVVTLRPLKETDRDGLTDAAGDPQTWAGHPAKERYKPEVFGPYFEFLLSAGGTLAVEDAATGRIIGCSRYYAVPDRAGEYGIGFTFLNYRCWGGATNRAMKALMFEHAFQTQGSVWFHIDPTNIRSQKATAKLGAVWVEDKALDLGTGEAMWKVYEVTRDAWQRSRAYSSA